MTDFTINDNIFCPISVGSPKFNKKTITALGEWAKTNNEFLTIVLFDSLRFFTNLQKGKSKWRAMELTKQTTSDQCRMIDDALNKSSTSFDILKSSDLTKQPEFVLNKEKVRHWVLENQYVFEKLENLVNNDFDKLNISNSQYNRFIQFEYFIEECAIALTFVSKPSVKFELYPKNENSLISLLFENHSTEFSDQSLVHGGRKFRSWDCIGLIST